MATTSDQVPDNVDALKAALIETRAKLSGATALIEHLQLVIAKMKREMFGPRSERSQRLIDQLELQLEELAAAAGEDATEAEAARVCENHFCSRGALAESAKNGSPTVNSSVFKSHATGLAVGSSPNFAPMITGSESTAAISSAT